MNVIDRVRIMVLGDSGVGKTSFVNLAVYNEPVRSPSWTIGCSVEVKLHEFKEGTKDQKTYFVEFWDIGGSNNHRNARQVFYKPCHGVILVHDLTNSKSEQNLTKWLDELMNPEHMRDSSTSSIFDDYDSESLLGYSKIPILVVGTKADLSETNGTLSGRKNKRGMKFASQIGAVDITLNCRRKRDLQPGTTNSVKLARFYDKIIELKYRDTSNASFTYRHNTNTISPVLQSKFYSLHQD